ELEPSVLEYIKAFIDYNTTIKNENWRSAWRMLQKQYENKLIVSIQGVQEVNIPGVGKQKYGLKGWITFIDLASGQEFIQLNEDGYTIRFVFSDRDFQLVGSLDYDWNRAGAIGSTQVPDGNTGEVDWLPVYPNVRASDGALTWEDAEPKSLSLFAGNRTNPTNKHEERYFLVHNLKLPDVYTIERRDRHQMDAIVEETAAINEHIFPLGNPVHMTPEELMSIRQFEFSERETRIEAHYMNLAPYKTVILEYDDFQSPNDPNGDNIFKADYLTLAQVAKTSYTYLYNKYWGVYYLLERNSDNELTLANGKGALSVSQLSELRQRPKDIRAAAVTHYSFGVDGGSVAFATEVSNDSIRAMLNTYAQDHQGMSPVEMARNVLMPYVLAEMTTGTVVKDHNEIVQRLLKAYSSTAQEEIQFFNLHKILHIRNAKYATAEGVMDIENRSWDIKEIIDGLNGHKIETWFGYVDKNGQYRMPEGSMKAISIYADNFTDHVRWPVAEKSYATIVNSNNREEVMSQAPVRNIRHITMPLTVELDAGNGDIRLRESSFTQSRISFGVEQGFATIHVGDKGMKEFERIKTLQLVENYLYGSNKADVRLAAQLEQEVLWPFVQDIVKQRGEYINPKRGPPRVVIIDTDRVTFQATYQSNEHVVYVERPVLEAISSNQAIPEQSFPEAVVTRNVSSQPEAEQDEGFWKSLLKTIQGWINYLKGEEEQVIQESQAWTPTDSINTVVSELPANPEQFSNLNYEILKNATVQMTWAQTRSEIKNGLGQLVRVKNDLANPINLLFDGDNPWSPLVSENNWISHITHTTTDLEYPLTNTAEDRLYYTLGLAEKATTSLSSDEQDHVYQLQLSADREIVQEEGHQPAVRYRFPVNEREISLFSADFRMDGRIIHNFYQGLGEGKPRLQRLYFDGRGFPTHVAEAFADGQPERVYTIFRTTTYGHNHLLVESDIDFEYQDGRYIFTGFDKQTLLENGNIIYTNEEDFSGDVGSYTRMGQFVSQLSLHDQLRNASAGKMLRIAFDYEAEDILDNIENAREEGSLEGYAQISNSIPPVDQAHQWFGITFGVGLIGGTLATLVYYLRIAILPGIILYFLIRLLSNWKTNGYFRRLKRRYSNNPLYKWQNFIQLKILPVWLGGVKDPDTFRPIHVNEMDLQDFIDYMGSNPREAFLLVLLRRKVRGFKNWDHFVSELKKGYVLTEEDKEAIRNARYRKNVIFNNPEEVIQMLESQEIPFVLGQSHGALEKVLAPLTENVDKERKRQAKGLALIKMAFNVRYESKGSVKGGAANVDELLRNYHIEYNDDRQILSLTDLLQIIVDHDFYDFTLTDLNAILSEHESFRYTMPEDMYVKRILRRVYNTAHYQAGFDNVMKEHVERMVRARVLTLMTNLGLQINPDMRFDENNSAYAEKKRMGEATFLFETIVRHITMAVDYEHLELPAKKLTEESIVYRIHKKKFEEDKKNEGETFEMPSEQSPSGMYVVTNDDMELFAPTHYHSTGRIVSLEQFVFYQVMLLKFQATTGNGRYEDFIYQMVMYDNNFKHWHRDPVAGGMIWEWIMKIYEPLTWFGQVGNKTKFGVIFRQMGGRGWRQGKSEAQKDRFNQYLNHQWSMLWEEYNALYRYILGMDETAPDNVLRIEDERLLHSLDQLREEYVAIFEKIINDPQSNKAFRSAGDNPNNSSPENYMGLTPPSAIEIRLLRTMRAVIMATEAAKEMDRVTVRTNHYQIIWMPIWYLIFKPRKIAKKVFASNNPYRQHVLDWQRSFYQRVKVIIMNIAGIFFMSNALFIFDFAVSALPIGFKWGLLGVPQFISFHPIFVGMFIVNFLIQAVSLGIRNALVNRGKMKGAVMANLVQVKSRILVYLIVFIIAIIPTNVWLSMASTIVPAGLTPFMTEWTWVLPKIGRIMIIL
ncbi:MAG: hypothetical protein KC713_04200, partial [Candidatus Omnitrophica bacterium]|nr:hypothetical protein [Candidatus Omnitrophota bacterium]